MKEEILHTSPTVLISWILSIAALGFLFIIFTVERERIRVGLSGTDITWQFLELAGIVWLVMFPLLVVSSLLGNHADKEAWSALEIICGVSVAGKGYYKYVDKDKKTQSSSYERTTHTTKEPKVDKPSGDPTSFE
jgi:hypothetical protein